MEYPIADNYIETLERVTKQLFEMAFTERHPEPLTYEEIQALTSEVNALNIEKLYNETPKDPKNKDSLRLYKGMFSDILRNPHVVNKTAQNRITIIPYYPDGSIFESENGNKLHYSIKDGMLMATGTYADGKTSEYEVISYLFDGDKITKRLIKEGWEWENKFQSEEHKLLFYFSQLNQLQEAIFERWEDVRVMFDYIEKGNLKKFKKADFDTALLEKEGKEKPEAWKAKKVGTTVTYDEIRPEVKKYFHKTPTYTPEEMDKRYNALFSYLSPGGISQGAKGCLREGVDKDMLFRALHRCVLKEISNRNRIDVLYCAFRVYANYYIFDGDKNKYIEDLDRQILEMNLKTNYGKKPEIEQKIENFFK